MSYFSSHYDAQWYETPDGVVPIYSYSYNFGYGGSGGTRWTIGSTYRFDVSLITGGVAYTNPVSFAVAAGQVFSDISRPWGCIEEVEPVFGYRRYCSEYIDFSSGRASYVNFP